LRRTARLAVDEGHHEVDEIVRFADGVDGDDVGVRDPRGGLRLAHEARANIGSIGQFRGQDLDRHRALQLLVARPVDHTHTAPPDLGLDGVRITESRGQPRLQPAIAAAIRHCSSERIGP
jgi:hypothetical protein